MALLAATGALVGLAWAMQHTSFDTWGAIIVAPVLFVLTIPLARHAGRAEADPSITRLILAAVAVKLVVGSLVRYAVAYEVYGGSADSTRYDRVGEALAPLFRQGIFEDLGQISGTRFMELLTGVVYTFTGPTRLGGFVVFAWLSFLGCYLFYRAFRVAYPDGDQRRYRLLVFFFPSLLYWPSSIGKEAFMLLVLGACALGLAHLLQGRLRGLLWTGLGLWGAAVVRPHLALVVLAAAAVSLPVHRTRPTKGEGDEAGGAGRPVAKLVMIGVLAVVSSLVVSQARQFFGLEDFDAGTAQALLESTEERTDEGQSQFATSSPTSPAGMGQALVTVLFRPFPFEVANAQGLVTGVEGLLLVGLAIGSARRIARLPRELVRAPYLAFALGYLVAFAFAFASINNFGILARQRVQVLPLLFVLFCVRPRPVDLADTGDGALRAPGPAHSSGTFAGSQTSRGTTLAAPLPSGGGKRPGGSQPRRPTSLPQSWARPPPFPTGSRSPAR